MVFREHANTTLEPHQLRSHRGRQLYELNEAGGERIFVTAPFGGIPTYRVGSRSRSTRESRASFLATVRGYRSSGVVFRVFSRIVRSRSPARCVPPSRVLLTSRASCLRVVPATSGTASIRPRALVYPLLRIDPRSHRHAVSFRTSTRRRAAEIVRSM